MTTTVDTIDREEQRARARAERLGLRLRKSRRDGSYILVDVMGRRANGEPDSGGWSLDDIGEWLDADEEATVRAVAS
jgi:hypothetical protein